MTRYQHFDPYPYHTHRTSTAAEWSLRKLPVCWNCRCWQILNAKDKLWSIRWKLTERNPLGAVVLTLAVRWASPKQRFASLMISCQIVAQRFYRAYQVLNWLNCCKLRQESKSELSEQTATNEVYLVTTWNSVPWRDMDMLTCWDSGVLIRKNKIKTNTSRCST